MTRFLTRRLLGGALTLLLFLTGLFFVVNMLIPGDWTSQFIMDGESRQALRESLGIDRPLAEQFWSWMSSVVSLDLGTSFRGEPVWTAVRDAMATTLFVFAAATVIAFPIGFWLGRTSAWNQRRWFTIPNTALAVVLFTAFPPAVAFLLERGVTNVLSAQAFRTLTQLDVDRWAEAVRRPFGSDEVADEIGAALSVPEVLWRMLVISAVLLVVVLLVRWAAWIIFDRRLPPGVMAALIALGAVIGWGLTDFSAQAFDVASTLLLLIAGLVALTYGEVLLVTDAAMLDTRGEDFILTARAKGLTEREVRDRHSARVALLPVLTRLVVGIPYFFTGLVILEFIFEVQGGLGNLLFEAINNQDTPLIVGAMAVVGVITLLLRLALEIAIAVLDPRIRLVGEKV